MTAADTCFTALEDLRELDEARRDGFELARMKALVELEALPGTPRQLARRAVQNMRMPGDQEPADVRFRCVAGHGEFAPVRMADESLSWCCPVCGEVGEAAA